jgi:DNA adenine methylase
MWKENKYRTNEHIPQHWDKMMQRTFTHFYHVGSTEDLRNSMEEVLLVKPGYEIESVPEVKQPKLVQLALAEKKTEYQTRVNGE